MESNLDHIVSICADELNGVDTTRKKLGTLITTNYIPLCLELALYADAATTVVETIHILEGNGFLAPLAYDLIMALQLHGRRITGRDFIDRNNTTNYTPKLTAAHKKLCPKNTNYRANHQ